MHWLKGKAYAIIGLPFFEVGMYASTLAHIRIIQKFTNLLVQLSIFLIDFFDRTYRLSSHARLEAFVIQTKLN